MHDRRQLPGGQWYINIMYDTVLYYNTWYYNYILLFYIIYPLSWNIIFNLLIDEYIFSSISFYECVYLFSTHDTSQLPGVDVRWTVVNSTATAISWHEIHLRSTRDITGACKMWNKDEQGVRNILLDFSVLNVGDFGARSVQHSLRPQTRCLSAI